MRYLLLYVLAGTLLISCGGQNSKIDYKNKIDTTSIIDDRVRDTTKMLVSELPVKFDSTDVLIFPIGLVDLQERGGYSKIGSGSYTSQEIESSYFHHDNLVGNFINLVFRNNNGKEIKLTDKKLRIRSASFLRQVFKATKQGYILYFISDRDSNGDEELNNSDLEALYISNADGTGFKKITKELHEFYDYTLIKNENRIYFRTLEDINKDGELKNNDKFHYYQIDFALNSYSITEYNPLKAFE